MAVKRFNCGQSAGKTFDKIGYYLSGFADGEGSFNVSIIKRSKDYRYGWKISLAFNISQKDDVLPKLFQKTLKCGTIRYRKDGICYYEVRKLNDLLLTVIPFFKRYPIVSNKQNVFRIFSEIAILVLEKKHLAKKGMEKILKLRDLIIVGRKRKYSKEEILKSYQKNPQRSYAKPPLSGVKT